MSKSFTYTFNIFTFFMIIDNIHFTDMLKDFYFNFKEIQTRIWKFYN